MLRKVDKNAILRIAVIILLIIGIGLLFYIATSALHIRPFQDDTAYYFPHTIPEYLVELEQRYGWTGRLTTTTVYMTLGVLKMFWIVPLIGLFLMVFGIFRLTKVILERVSHTTRNLLLISMACGVYGTLAIYILLPSPYSAVFWLSSAPIHFWAYGCILIYSSFIVQRLFSRHLHVRGRDWFFMVIFSAIIGMFSEMAGLILFGLSASAALVFLIRKQYDASLLMLPSVLGSVLAILALLFSPGAVNRRNAEQVQIDMGNLIGVMPEIVKENFEALFFNGVMPNKSILIIMFTLATTLTLLFLKVRVRMQSILITTSVVMIVLVGVACANFVSIYISVQTVVAWERAQSLSVIVVLIGIIFAGIIAGVLLRSILTSKTKAGIIVTCLLIMVGVAGYKQLYIPHVQGVRHAIYARSVEFDKRDSYLRSLQKPTCPIKATATSIAGVQEGVDILPDPNHIRNIEFARYFELPCHIEADE